MLKRNKVFMGIKKVEEVKATLSSENDKPGTMAILSLISGILSVMGSCIPIVGAFLGFILSVVSIVLGTIELKRIKKDDTGQKGRGLAITGIILGGLGILIGIFWLIVITIMWIAGAFGNIPNISW